MQALSVQLPSEKVAVERAKPFFARLLSLGSVSVTWHLALAVSFSSSPELWHRTNEPTNDGCRRSLGVAGP